MGKEKVITISSSPEKLDFNLLNHLENIDGEVQVRHFLCCSIFPVKPFGKCVNNFIVNQTYRTNLKLYKEHLKNKDYDGLFLHIEKQFRLVWFIKNYKKIYSKVGEKKYYELLGDILVMVDKHYKTKKHYSKLFNIGNDPRLMMSSYEKFYFLKLPNENIIYRGVYSKEKLKKRNIRKYIGNSWTLDMKKSIWFSGFNSKSLEDGYYYLLKYVIKKEYIVSYFSQRKEKEIFIDYKKIDLSKLSIITLENELVNKVYKVKT